MPSVILHVEKRLICDPQTNLHECLHRYFLFLQSYLFGLLNVRIKCQPIRKSQWYMCVCFDIHTDANNNSVSIMNSTSNLCIYYMTCATQIYTSCGSSSRLGQRVVCRRVVFRSCRHVFLCLYVLPYRTPYVLYIYFMYSSWPPTHCRIFIHDTIHISGIACPIPI